MYVPGVLVSTVPELVTGLVPSQASLAEAPGSMKGCPVLSVIGFDPLSVITGAAESETFTVREVETEFAPSVAV